MAGDGRVPNPRLAPGCPDNRALHRLLAGLLAEGEAGPVERHVESCATCLERLEELSADDRRSAAGLERARGAADEPVLVTALIRWLCQPSSVWAIGLPTPGSTDTSPEADRAPRREPPTAPERLGRYRVLRCLGVGGMGTVYLADDPELGRPVAVKVPRFAGPPAAQAAARQRFLREARAAAAVRHRHVCPIHDVGEHDGTPYVVMACIEGQSLAERLARDGRFADVRAAVALAAQVADALAAVHDRGIVHRDLKPSNVLLDAAGDAYLSDFGLARRQDEADRVTAPGALVGTVGYMAPEQVDATRFGPVTPRTDLFSLGVVLYELLTGRRPFEAEGRAALLYQIVHDAPPLPRRLRSDLDARLEAVILKALAKNPADRWPDCRAFAEALRGADTHQRGPRRVWWVAAVAAAVLVASGSFLAWQALRPPVESTRSDQPTPPPEPSKGKPKEVPKPPRSPRPGVLKLEGHTQTVHALAFSPNGRLLASAGEDRTLRVWDVATGKNQTRIPHDPKVYCLAFAPVGGVLASGGADRVVTLWDVETWAKKGTLAEGRPAAITWLAFSPHGRTLVMVCHRQNVAAIWDVGTGKQVALLDGHTNPVNAAAFSPDGTTVATVSDDRTVRLWDAVTGRAKGLPLKAHVQPVTCVAFSRDGTRLATGSEDRTIVVWDVATGRPIQPALEEDGPVVFVGWAPDGRLVSKTFRDRVSLWTLGVSEPAAVRGKFDKPIAGVFAPVNPQVALTTDGRVLAFRHCHPYSGHDIHLVDLAKFLDPSE